MCMVSYSLKLSFHFISYLVLAFDGVVFFRFEMFLSFYLESLPSKVTELQMCEL